LNRKEKEIFVTDIADKLKKARATFVVDYKGMDVEAMNSLRRELREKEAEIHVVKNRLVRRACQDTDTSSIIEYFSGPCALALTYADVVAPAKTLVEHEKKSEHLKIKVGQIAGRVVELNDIRRLAELPSREVLLGQVLSAMHGVPTSLVRVLNGVIMKLLYALKAIESKKSENE